MRTRLVARVVDVLLESLCLTRREGVAAAVHAVRAAAGERLNARRQLNHCHFARWTIATDDNNILPGHFNSLLRRHPVAHRGTEPTFELVVESDRQVRPAVHVEIRPARFK